MITSTRQTDAKRRKNGWLRRGHRWLGGALAVFVLLLSCTGIALNHSDDWNLAGRYVTWPWLLSAYGIRVPDPAASFSDREHHAVLLGQRLYFDQQQIADGENTLTGLIVTGNLALVTTGNRGFVLTVNGELVEQLDLSQLLPGGIDRLGRLQDRAVIQSAGTRYRSDADMTGFEAWHHSINDNVTWSRQSPLPAPLLNSIRHQYRGSGLSVERLLLDIHGGRLLGSTGPLFMDLVAVLLIVLSGTGLVLWLRRGGRSH